MISARLTPCGAIAAPGPSSGPVRRAASAATAAPLADEVVVPRGGWDDSVAVDVTTRRFPAGVDGGVLVCDCYGDEGDPPVLFLHGGGQTRFAWERTAMRVAKAGFYAVCLDMKGHGESYWDPSGDYASKAYAEDLDRFVRLAGLVGAAPADGEAGGAGGAGGVRGIEGGAGASGGVRGVGPRRPVIIGASLGGLTTLMSEAAKDARSCAGVVLVDIAPRMEVSGVNRIVSFMMRTAETGFDSLDHAADVIAEYMPHRTRAKNTQSLRKNLRQASDGRYFWHWDPRFFADKGEGHTHVHTKDTLEVAREMYMDAAARIPVGVPALLVRGGASDMVSAQGVREFLQAVPHGRFVDVTDADHMVAGDRNDAFAAEVISFLKHDAAGGGTSAATGARSRL